MNDNNQRRDNENEEMRGILTDFLKVFGRFLRDLGKISMRAMWILYRSFGRRRTQPEHQADHAERQADNAIGDMRNFFRRKTQPEQTTAETTPAETERIQSTPANTGGGFVEMTEESDPEAAALLENLLQQTAREMQQHDTDIDSALDDEPIAPITEEAVPIAETPIEAINTPPPATTIADDAPPVAIPDEERERIRAIVDEKERIQADEAQQREQIGETKEEKQERIRKAMEADKARIAEEQRQRREAFERAEAERRQREQRKRAHLGERLTDTEPDDNDDTHADDTPMSSKNL